MKKDTTRRETDELVTTTSQIRRQSFPGPSKKSLPSKQKNSTDDGERDSELEKQIFISLKKTPKEVTTIEGKVNIISQM